jgi:hypothetical protein
MISSVSHLANSTFVGCSACGPSDLVIVEIGGQGLKLFAQAGLKL